MEKVTFKSEGLTLKGNLYVPPNYTEDQQYPAIVTAGTWTSVKEQMANRYAEKLAKHGYITLSFDFRTYGESEGEPRNFENPSMKIEDIQHAVTYLLSRDDVAKDKIGGLGICAGAAYISGAAAHDHRIKSIALVAPWIHNREITEAVYGGAEGVKAKIEAANQAKQKYAQEGIVEYVPKASKDDPSAAMYGSFEFYFDENRGAIPEWQGDQFAVMGWAEWLNFDGVATASHIKVPVLIVHSEEAAIPQGAKAYYDLLNVPKDFLWLEGGQFDFYDQEPNVSESVKAAAKHFAATL